MTYEKFAEDMIDKDEGLTRKDLRSFAVKYAIMMLWCGLAISTVISSVLGTLFGITFMILVVLLYVFSFDVMVENEDYYIKLRNILKRWWLISLGITLVCILINLFLV